MQQSMKFYDETSPPNAISRKIAQQTPNRHATDEELDAIYGDMGTEEPAQELDPAFRDDSPIETAMYPQFTTEGQKLEAAGKVRNGWGVAIQQKKKAMAAEKTEPKPEERNEEPVTPPVKGVTRVHY